MRNSYRKPAEYEVYYQYLVENKLFDTYRDIYMISIILGFMNDKKSKLGKSGGDPIKEHYFAGDRELMDIISVLSTDGIQILLVENKDDKVELMEEYANEGIKILVDNIFQGKYTDIDKIVDYVLSFAPESNSEKVDFSEFFLEIADGLDENREDRIKAYGNIKK